MKGVGEHFCQWNNGGLRQLFDKASLKTHLLKDEERKLRWMSFLMKPPTKGPVNGPARAHGSGRTAVANYRIKMLRVTYFVESTAMLPHLKCSPAQKAQPAASDKAGIYRSACAVSWQIVSYAGLLAATRVAEMNITGISTTAKLLQIFRAGCRSRSVREITDACAKTLVLPICCWRALLQENC